MTDISHVLEVNAAFKTFFSLFIEKQKKSANKGIFYNKQDVVANSLSDNAQLFTCLCPIFVMYQLIMQPSGDPCQLGKTENIT